MRSPAGRPEEVPLVGLELRQAGLADLLPRRVLRAPRAGDGKLQAGIEARGRPGQGAIRVREERDKVQVLVRGRLQLACSTHIDYKSQGGVERHSRIPCNI